MESLFKPKAKTAVKTTKPSKISKAELEQKILAADKAYYESGKSSLTDAQYDSIKDQLRTIDPHNSVLRFVGSPVEHGEKVKLPIPMGSLNKQRPLEIARWILSLKTDIIVLPKLDGMSGLLHYRSGKLIGIYSRGDGYTGRMLLQHAKNIQGVKESISLAGEVFIKCEFIIHRHLFKVYGKKAGYSSPRNFVVGMLNRKEGCDIFRKMTAITYEVSRRAGPKSEFEPMGKYEQLRLLKEMGFIIANEPWRRTKTKFSKVLDTMNADWYANLNNPKKSNQLSQDMLKVLDKIPVAYKATVLPIYLSWENISRWTPESLSEYLINSFFMYYQRYCDVDLDGIVVSIDDAKISQKLNTDPLFPKASFSMKLDPADQEAKEATVVDVEWNMSPRKIFKPVIRIKPVEFNGVRVEFVTGINAKNIQDLGIGAGSKVKVIRSGDVIPRIVGVNKKATVKVPTKCPKCGKPLAWTKTKVDVYCANENCTNDKDLIVRFFKTLNFQAQGVGEGILQQLVDYCEKKSGNVTIVQLLKLTKEELKKLPGFADVSAEKTVYALRGIVSDASLEALMHASGYFANENIGLGVIRLKSIIDAFGMDQILSAEFTEDSFDGVEIHGISKASVAIFIQGIVRYQKLHRDLLPYLGALTLVPKSEILKGKVFCFTGFRDALLERKIIENGGTISASFTRKVNVLLSDGANSTKMQQAKAAGIQIIVRDNIGKALKI